MSCEFQVKDKARAAMQEIREGSCSNYKPVT